jgi:predicted O-linked N-acetylglucosamine transferase (SPINDLY family)
MNKIQTIQASSFYLKAEKYWYEGKYNLAAQIYEEAITAESNIKQHYWYLGLMLLLQNEEVEAQLTWFAGMDNGEANNIDELTQELAVILDAEALRQESLEEYQLAWTVRQHLREVIPTDFNNLLKIIYLSLKLELLSDDSVELSEAATILNSNDEINIDCDLLIQTLKNLLNIIPEYPLVLNFVESLLNSPHVENVLIFIDIVMLAAIDIGSYRRQPDLASNFVDICVKRQPENRQLLGHLSCLYQDSQQYIKGIEVAKQCYGLAESILDKSFANHLLIRSLTEAGCYWNEAYSQLNIQINLLEKLIRERSTGLNYSISGGLSNLTYFLPYFEDQPKRNSNLKNQLAAISLQNLQSLDKELYAQHHQQLVERTNNKSPHPKTLKIGYLSHCFKKHSVGWLSRWLFKYHNPEKYQIHTYFIAEANQYGEFTQRNFADYSSKFYTFHHTDNAILDQIQKDEIDILIDLDSLTLNCQTKIMSVKAAPIQVTWLGWDASGLPSIDYFIADPYVLPDYAQDYYTEKIWRLPNTYIAVDGFEVATPTIRREDLNIPHDAIVYFMVQSGCKRNLPNLRLQMKILAEVPNSYLLIKGLADEELSQKSLEVIAEEEGVSPSQLRFLPFSHSEAIHRANLGIADIVLDTFPYNGATTTLETLWMGIPLVTRVGEQFAARNSYTMIMNAGITEGIAWTDEEYIEWGIRLGKDINLRQQVAWKLRQSRHSAPLWNAKQFTREMENAYEQMWQIYVSGK